MAFRRAGWGSDGRGWLVQSHRTSKYLLRTRIDAGVAEICSFYVERSADVCKAKNSTYSTVLCSFGNGVLGSHWGKKDEAKFGSACVGTGYAPGLISNPDPRLSFPSRKGAT